MFFYKKRTQIKENLVTALEIPRDLACRETVLTLTGQSQAVIENYRSIIKLTREEIVVSTFSGKLSIIGKALEIPWYTPEEMLIKGDIIQVKPER